MKIGFTDIMIFFQWGCIMASAIFSIKLIGNNTIPAYMKNFYWYSLAGGVSSMHGLLREYTSIINFHISVVIYSVFLVFHFVFLSLFIYKVLPRKNKTKHLKLLFYLFLLTILFYLITNDLSFFPSAAVTITNLGLVLFCCMYYFQLFKDALRINLLKEPSFWIVSGIFFCMCATIPVFSLSKYLHDNLPAELFFLMNCIVAFAYGVMHLFFIKAYLLCSIKVQDHETFLGGIKE